jgi:hypothetical protein
VYQATGCVILYDEKVVLVNGCVVKNGQPKPTAENGSTKTATAKKSTKDSPPDGVDNRKMQRAKCNTNYNPPNRVLKHV